MTQSLEVPHGTIEIELSWGPAMRGVRWGTGEDIALFLHEPGTDLDAWGQLPREIARVLPVECRVFDLPGHGLSDDPWLFEQLPEIVRELASPGMAGGKVMVIAAGENSPAALALAGEIGLAGFICLSPVKGEANPPRSARTPKHFFAGAQADDDLDVARRLASACGGWAVVTSIPVSERGTGLLATDWGPRIAEAVAGSVRDYLRPQPVNALGARTTAARRTYSA